MNSVEITLSQYFMNKFNIIEHAPGAPGLRYLGLGPNLSPQQGIKKLNRLLNKNTFWAKNRSKSLLRKMLSKSNVVITAWANKNLVGFGRATTDETFRAVLWDIVVDEDYQINGIGMEIVNRILKHRLIRKVEKVYLMTTYCQNFYRNNGFVLSEKQGLMIYRPNINN